MSLKAFTLVSVLERNQLLVDKINFQISCMEICGKNLYIGTEDSRLLHFLIEENQGGRNNASKFQCSRQGQKLLESQKPVIQLKATTALNRIFALCDSSIVMLNMLNFELFPSFRIKFVNVFALNSSPSRSDPFSVELCVGTKKRSIQLYVIKDDVLVLLREFQLDGMPIALKMDGSVMCVGMSQDYKMVDCQTGFQQELFQYDPKQVTPVIVHISENEYLLSASNALGIFALSEGISHRPPLQWLNNIISVAHVCPYIVVLNDEFITVHSILDQQQKQTMQFTGGVSIEEFGGKIFVTTRSDVYCLLPEPLERQIQSLLDGHRISEALGLAKNASKTEFASDEFNKMIRRIEQQAGFVEFSKMNFEEASKLFVNGKLDPREVISLYPGLLPSNSSFTKSSPLHGIVNVNHLCRDDDGGKKMEKYEQFLLDYLELISPVVRQDVKLDVNTANLKLTCKHGSSNLADDIARLKDAVDATSCVAFFQEHGKHHCSALVLSQAGDTEAALAIWKRLCDNEIEDDTFPGFEYVVDIFSNVADASLVWKFSDWFMSKDQKKAVKVFTDQYDAGRFSVDVVSDYLSRYEDASVIFLEHLVFKKNLQDEKYHTHLATLYLNKVLQLKKNLHKSDEEKQLNKAREKLCRFLKESSSYRVQLLLGRVQGTDLHHECALLHGKLEEHDIALNILAEKIQNFKAAEDYCAFYSRGRPPQYRAGLFQTLLRIYLNSKNFKEQYLEPAIVLLNKHQHEFDPIKVLQIVPSDWSNTLLENFLASSIRSSLNRRRTTQIQYMLSKGENGSAKRAFYSGVKNPVVINDERLCSLCSRPFNDPVFVSFPQSDNVIAHLHCQQNLNPSHNGFRN